MFLIYEQLLSDIDECLSSPCEHGSCQDAINHNVL